MKIEITDIQERSWKSFLSKDLYRCVENARVDNEDLGYSLKFEALMPRVPHELSGEHYNALKYGKDFSAMLSVKMKIETDKSQFYTKNTEEVLDILNIPIYTSNGFIKDGHTYVYIGEQTPADGWYVLKGKSGTVQAERKSKRGISFKIYKGATGTFVSKIQSGKQSEIPLEVFMLAVFKTSLSEIKDSIGASSQLDMDCLDSESVLAYLNSTKKKFRSSDIVSMCQELVYDTFRSSTYEVPLSRVEKNLINVISGERTYQTSYSRKRLRKMVSYTYRCVGLLSAEEIKDGTLHLEKGGLITKQIAELLDTTKIDSISVYRESDPDTTFIVKRYIQDDYEESHSELELVNVLNIYYNYLSGLKIRCEENTMDNMILKTVSSRFCDEIEKRLNEVKDGVFNEFRSIKNSTGTVDVAVLTNACKNVAKRNNESLMRLLKDEGAFQQLEVVSNIGRNTKGSKVMPEASIKNFPINSRLIKEGERGRICCNETPDGQKIGVVRTLAIYADVDEYNCITTPYCRVIGGIIDTSETVHLSYIDELGKYVAPADANLNDEFVDCYYYNDVVRVSKDLVEYIEVSNSQNFGIGVNATAAASLNSGRRNTMGANNIRQAVNLTRSERPIVDSPVGSMVSSGIYTVKDIKDYIAVHRNVTAADELDKIADGDLVLENVFCNNGLRKCQFSIRLNGEVVTQDFVVLETLRESEKGSMMHSRINAQNNSVWTKDQSDDIVIYGSDYDIGEYELYRNPDKLGNGVENKPEQFKNRSAALGVTLNVLYKFHEGFGIDDAIVIRRGLMDSGTLSSIYVTTETVNAEVSGDIIRYIYTKDIKNKDAYPDSDIAKLESDGFPRIGSYIEKGQLLVGRIAIMNDTVQGRTVTKEVSKNYESTQSGYVIEVVKGEKEIVIYLGDTAKIEKGDKMTGRHGNKGVVARIVADNDMPFAADGTLVDIVLNPNGVPSRNNNGQLLESAIAALKGNSKKVMLFESYEKIDAYSIDSLRASGVGEVDVYDGRTCKKFPNKMFIGKQYFYKLEHMVSSKVHAIGNANDNRVAFTNQPREGKKQNGAQKMSENLMNALTSSGATVVLNELTTLMSDNANGSKYFDQLQKSIGSLDAVVLDKNISYDNKSFEFVTPVMYALGVEFLPNEADKVMLTPITDADILRLSSSELPVGDSRVNKKTLTDNIGGHCATVKEREEARATFNRISLGKFGVVMPMVYRSVAFRYAHPVNKLRKIYGEYIIETGAFSENDIDKLVTANSGACMYLHTDIEGIVQPYYAADKSALAYLETVLRDRFDTSNIYYDGVALVKFVSNYGLGRSDRYWLNRDIIARLEEIEEMQAEGEKDSEKLSNLAAVYYLDGISHSVRSDKSYVPTALRKFKAAMKSVESVGKVPEDFIVHNMLVIPDIMRSKMEMSTKSGVKNGEVTVDDFTTIYCAIMTEVHNLDNMKLTLNSKHGLTGLYNTLMRSTNANGFDDADTIKSFLSSLKSKEGFFRKRVLAKRVMFSGRSVLTPSPKTPTTSARVPAYIIAEVYKSAIMAGLSSAGVLATSRKMALKAFKTGNYAKIEEKLGAIQALELKELVWRVATRVTKGRPVIPVREPAFHEFNGLAFDIEITTDSTIGISPIVAAGYNADYDGDQVAAFFPMSDAAVAEARQKLYPDVLQVNIKDGGVIIGLPQDICLGLYELTSLHNNEKTVHAAKDYYFHSDGDLVVQQFNSIEALVSALNYEYVSPQELAVLKFGGYRYMSTVGRLLANSKLPIQLNNGKILASRTLGFTTKPWKNPLGLPVANEAGFCDLKYDFTWTNRDIKNIKNDVYEMCKGGSKSLEVYDSLKSLGFKYSDSSGVSLSIFDYAVKPEIDVKVKETQNDLDLLSALKELRWVTEGELKDIQSELMDGLRSYAMSESVNSLSRTNNLFRISDSGARASKGNICDTIGVIGSTSDSKGNLYGKPIMTNYSNGLRGMDAVLLANSTLAGSIGTSLQSADTGYDGRKIRMLMQDMVVSENNCGSAPRQFTVIYGDAKELESYRGWELIEIDCNGALGFAMKTNLMSGLADTLVDSVKTLLDISVVKLDSRVIRFLNKIKPKHITLTKGGVVEKVELKYSIDRNAMSIVLGHYGVENAESSKLSNTASGAGTYTKKSLDIINELQLPSVPIRLLHNCNSSYGVCSECYGIDVTTNDRIEIGKHIGYKTAAALHESFGQATLNSKNNGATSREESRSLSILVEMSEPNSDSIFRDSESYKGKGSTLMDTFSEAFDVIRVTSTDEAVNLLLEKNLKQLVTTQESCTHLRNGEIVIPCDKIIDYLYLDTNYLRTVSEELFSDLDVANSFYIYHSVSRYKLRYSGDGFTSKMLELASASHDSLSLVTYSDNPKYLEGNYYNTNEVSRAAGVVSEKVSLGSSRKSSVNNDFLTGIAFEDVGAMLKNSLLIKADYCRSVNAKFLTSSSLLGTKPFNAREYYIKTQEEAWERATSPDRAKVYAIDREGIDIDFGGWSEKPAVISKPVVVEEVVPQVEKYEIEEDFETELADELEVNSEEDLEASYSKTSLFNTKDSSARESKSKDKFAANKTAKFSKDAKGKLAKDEDDWLSY